MTRKRNMRRVRQQVVTYVACALICLVFLLPAVHALARSLEGRGVYNYVLVLGDARLPRYLVNSLIYSIGSVFLTVVCSTAAGYAFAKLSFPLKHCLYYLLLSTILVSGATLLMPSFLVVRALHLYDTYMALILPAVAWGVPFYTVLVRNFFEAVPVELSEAALIDGAAHWQILWYVMVPLSRPIQVVVVTLTFLGAWNDLFGPLVMVKDEKLITATLAALTWASSAGGWQMAPGAQKPSTQFAALLALATPTVLLFLVFQRAFVGSITDGALKM